MQFFRCMVSSLSYFHPAFAHKVVEGVYFFDHEGDITACGTHAVASLREAVFGSSKMIGGLSGWDHNLNLAGVGGTPPGGAMEKVGGTET